MACGSLTGLMKGGCKLQYSIFSHQDILQAYSLPCSSLKFDSLGNKKFNPLRRHTPGKLCIMPMVSAALLEQQRWGWGMLVGTSGLYLVSLALSRDARFSKSDTMMDQIAGLQD